MTTAQPTKLQDARKRLNKEIDYLVFLLDPNKERSVRNCRRAINKRIDALIVEAQAAVHATSIKEKSREQQ